MYPRRVRARLHRHAHVAQHVRAQLLEKRSRQRLHRPAGHRHVDGGGVAQAFARASRHHERAPRVHHRARRLRLPREPKRHSSIEIVTPEMRVAARREHLHGSPAHVEDGHVERTSSEVEDEHRLVAVDVHAVRERRGDGLVEDFDFFQSRALGGASRGVALLVVEIRGDGDDGAVDGFAERVARSVNESAEDVCGDFFRRELASERGASRGDETGAVPAGPEADDVEGVGVGGDGGAHLVGNAAGVLDHALVLVSLADEALDGVERVGGVLGEALARGVADQDGAVGEEGHHAGRRASTVLVRDDHGLAVHDHGDGAVGGAEVDTADGRARRHRRRPGAASTRGAGREEARGETPRRERADGGRGRTRAMRGEHRERRRHRASTRVERTRAHVQVGFLAFAPPDTSRVSTAVLFRQTIRVARDRRVVRRDARHTATRESIRPPSTPVRPRRRRRDRLPSPSLSSRARFPRRLLVRSRRPIQQRPGWWTRRSSPSSSA